MVEDESTRKLSRLLFGSCNSQHYYDGNDGTNGIWTTIRNRNASAFVWAGDAIYGDKPDDPSQQIEATPERLRHLYDQQVRSETYAALDIPVLGTLDDHDYGINNGDKTFRHRTESGELFVDFLARSSTDKDFKIIKDRVKRGKGVYYVKVFDFARPEGSELLSDEEAGVEPSTSGQVNPKVLQSERTVAIFMLDNRTNKDPWIKSFPDRLYPDFSGDFLGEEQWAWFEQSLSRSYAQVNIIVQGLQVHPDRFFDGSLVENWSRFPTAQKRLYQTILDSRVQAPVLVSGDVHMAEMYLKNCKKGDNHKPLLEVTTSGLTHSWCTNFFPRKIGHSNIASSPWITSSLCYGMHMAHYFWTDVLKANGIEGAKSGRQYTLDLNFGEFEFDWVNRRVITRILGADQNPPLLSLSWNFDDLSGTPLENNAEEWVCGDVNGGLSGSWKVIGTVIPISLAFFMSLSPFIFPIILSFKLLRKVKSESMRFRVLVGDQSKLGRSSS